jgi:hypothetical protein
MEVKSNELPTTPNQSIKPKGSRRFVKGFSFDLVVGLGPIIISYPKCVKQEVNILTISGPATSTKIFNLKGLAKH